MLIAKPTNVFVAVLALLFLACTTSKDENFAAIDRNELQQMLESQDVVVIDTRRPYTFSREHIPGAVNIPASHPQLDSLVARLSLQSRPVVAYCEGEHCVTAELLLARLQKMGVDSLYWYKNGWEEWRAGATGFRPDSSRIRGSYSSQ